MYRSLTVRVPCEIAKPCRELAAGLGWRLAPFVRTLIFTGACVLFLTVDNSSGEEAAMKLLGGVKLVRFTRSFTLRLRPRRRRYAFRMRGGKSQLITLTLPESFCRLVSIYAEHAHTTRNQTYYRFIQQGLITYTKATMCLLAVTKPQTVTDQQPQTELNERVNVMREMNPYREIERNV